MLNFRYLQSHSLEDTHLSLNHIHTGLVILFIITDVLKYFFEFQLAYMFWVQGYKLIEAHNMLQVNTPYLMFFLKVCVYLLLRLYSACLYVFLSRIYNKNQVNKFNYGHLKSWQEVHACSVSWPNSITFKFIKFFILKCCH